MKKLSVFLASLLLAGITLVQAQTVRITGTVTSSEDGMPMPGVSVVVKGTTIGVTTNVDGKYELNVPANAQTLQFSFVGYEMQDVAIAGRSVIDVVMNPESKQIDEVVVVAPYGTFKKESFTGSASAVKTEKLQEIQVSNVTKALEGLSSGIQVTSGLGQPGTTATIRIRGIGSVNASAAPLYVVDGFPFSGDINSIPSQDIENISVLKDASATSLYGSRAANGVIMITTKKGKKDRTQFTAVANIGISTRGIPEYDRLNSAEYMEALWQKVYNYNLANGDDDATARVNASSDLISTYTGGYNPFGVPTGEYVVGTDGKLNPNHTVLWNDSWYDELHQTGIRQDYLVSASGGSEKSKYYISGNYLNEDGIVQSSNYKRYSIRINNEHQLKDWFKLGLNLGASNSEQNYPVSSGSAYVNTFMWSRMIAPIYPVYLRDPNTGELVLDAQGKKQYDYGNSYGRARLYSANSNPLGTIVLDKRVYKDDNISARGFTEISFLKDFKFQVNSSVDYNGYFGLTHQNMEVGDAQSFGGRSTRDYGRSISLSANQLLYYNKSVNNHNIDALIGHESYQYMYNYLSATRTGFPLPDLYELDAAATNESSGSYESNLRLESYLARVNYDYLGKYYLSLSFRTDGSSRFHKDTRWGKFWSVGGSWRISDEEFLKGLSWLNNARLKASYGTTGNDQVGYYAYQALYSTEYANLNYPGFLLSRLGTPNLSWEKNIQINTGIEVRIFDRLSMNFEYYIRKSDDLLFTQPLPPSTGFSGFDANIGAVENRGFDIEVNANLVNTENFTWFLDLNLSHYKNEITKLPQEEMINGNKKWMVGHSIYDYYMRKFAGVDPTDGKSMWYQDVTHIDPVTNEVVVDSVITTKNYSDATRYYTGTSSIPDLVGGVTNSFIYKNFELSFLITFGIGGQVYDSPYAALMHGNLTNGTNFHKDILKAWSPDNTNSNIPINDYDQNVNATSDRFLIDADYISFKNLTIGYNLPKKFLSNYGIANAKLFVTGTNLYLKSKRKGLDPQQSISGNLDNVYTPLRTIAFGINLNF
ncbi:SusC/RagA family TonB-linked outer membrane protein [Tenuifilum thalassicum]|uniref:TonB-dependent receptor n=1 Tax=Tenuifilum thalassicum TaxID=2590900 RepID=A0A7D4CRZ3_9BACT|nr:TonB-dependent receptor [Tenuifilum thalassicum]QKG80405.1 TonB-dependent receptor [Tenuifilum thalassicum]